MTERILYRVILSIGNNGQTATVYNIGKIEKDTIPSAKLIAVVGSKPLGIASSKDSIRTNKAKSQEKFSENEEKFSGRDYSEGDYEKPITIRDIEILRSIGRKSINKFTSEDIKKAQKWAYKFYKELGTKSPFFRAWFGDWRTNDNVSITKVVNKKTNGQFSAGKSENKDTGKTISWEIK